MEKKKNEEIGKVNNMGKKEEKGKESETKKEEKLNLNEIKNDKKDKDKEKEKDKPINNDNNKMEIEEEEKKKDKEEVFITKQIFPKGLNNIGATCYMNSVLQSFYHIYDLSNELLKVKYIDERIMPMTSAYLEVIKSLTFSPKASISPYKFKEIISNNEIFKGITANDSKALTLYLLDTINEEFNDNNISIEKQKFFNAIRKLNDKGTERVVRFFNTQYNSVIGDLFNGLKKTTYKCLKCGDIFIDYQIFNIYSLIVEQTYNGLNKNNKEMGLFDCCKKQKKKENRERKIDIIDCFMNEEKTKIFQGENKIFCDKCNNLQEGEVTNKIYMSPKIMILFLDRGKNNRFQCEVNFNGKLDISNFVEKKGLKEEYELIASIEHLGSSGMGGHFIANCKHFDGNYYIFSDSSIYGPSNIYHQYGEPYLLFYRKID